MMSILLLRLFYICKMAAVLFLHHEVGFNRAHRQAKARFQPPDPLRSCEDDIECVPGVMLRSDNLGGLDKVLREFSAAIVIIFALS